MAGSCLTFSPRTYVPEGLPRPYLGHRDSAVLPPPGDLRRDIARLVRNGATAQARELVRAAHAANPDPGTAALLEFATLYGLVGETAACAEACRQVLARDPDSFQAWYQLGIALGMQKRNAEAEAALGEALRRSPADAGALNGLGNVLREQGRLAEAETSYRAALASRPDLPAVLANLGNLLRATGRTQEATDCLQRAVALAPCDAIALLGLGRALGETGRHADERKCYEQLIACQPRSADAWAALASLCARTRKYDEGTECCQRALSLQPSHVDARVTLGFIFQRTGRTEGAMTLYREAIERDPDHPGARHLLATLESDSPPARAPASYVRALFDDYAERFDRHLLGTLGYRTPEMLGRLVRPLLPQGVQLDILDLGCGTGLAGLQFHDLARRLVGVDLSPRMIEKARGRGIYTDLLVGDMLEVMAGAPGAYDLIIAADVLIYIGDLVPLMRGVAASLRPNGLFAFSAETEREALSFVLRDSGRYAHADAYVRAESSSVGMEVEHAAETVLRKDSGRDVAGCLYIARKRADSLTAA